MQIYPNKVRLPIPDLSPQNLLYNAVDLRPYRKGGVRLEHQVMSGRHIFHNYGHGGAGISLAYGSAYISAKSVSVYVGPSQLKTAECAVIGCGIMGLFTSIELAKRGYTTRIYTEAIPKLGAQKDLLTSQVAAGKWQPGGYDFEADYLKHQTLAKLSFQYYMDCVRNKRYQSIQQIKVYDGACKSIEELKRINTNFLIEKYTPVEVEFSNGRTQKCIEFETIALTTDVLLQELLTEAKLRGVEIIQRRFNSLQDILNLKEHVIMNCTGMGSQKLFQDNNLIGIKGNLLVFKNTNKIDYILASKLGDRQITVYAVGDRVMVGYTSVAQPIDPKLDEAHFVNIYNTAKLYFGQSSIKPKI